MITKARPLPGKTWEECVFTNGSMSNEDYHKHEGISSSSVYAMCKETPAKFRFGEKKETDALKKGTAIHAYMLEPELFEKQFIRGVDFEKEEGVHTSSKSVLAAMKKAGVLVTLTELKKKAKTLEPDAKPASRDDAIEIINQHDPDCKVFVGEPEKADDIYSQAAILCPDIKIKHHMEESFKKSNSDKTIVPADDYDAMVAMRKVLFSDYYKEINQCFNGAFFETSILCEVMLEGYDQWVPVKVRPDIITSNCIVPDYKTTSDISVGKFERMAFNLGYWHRQVFVCDVLSAVYGKEFKPALIAQDVNAPHEVRGLNMKNPIKEDGSGVDAYGHARDAYTEAVIKWDKCRRTDSWPSYGGGWSDMDCPNFW